MRKLDDIIGEHPSDRKDAFYAILELLCDEGVELVTDDRRAYLGLPPRGPLGSTDAEIRAMEDAQIAMISRPIFSPIQFIADNPVAQKDEAK